MNPDFGGNSPMLTGDLEKYRRQFAAVERDAREILDGLADAQLAWQPEPDVWSVRDCLDHLLVTGLQSLFHVAEAVEAGRSRGMFSPGPFRYGILERAFVWLMEPPARLKFPSPRAYRPASRRPGTIIVAEFLRFQQELGRSLHRLTGLDLARIKVRNPVSRWITFSLGQELALTGAHERRHLWQVRQIIAHPGFPTAERMASHGPDPAAAGSVNAPRVGQDH